MSRQIVLIISGMITALVIVLMLGVGATVAIQSNLAARISNAPAPAADVTALLPVSTSNAATTNLSAEQAARIAQNAAPNAKITAAPDLVNLQGTAAYEVKLNNGVIYIDANTGAVLYNSIATPTAPTVGTQRRSGEHSESEGEHHD